MQEVNSEYVYAVHSIDQVVHMVEKIFIFVFLVGLITFLSLQLKKIIVYH